MENDLIETVNIASTNLDFSLFSLFMRADYVVKSVIIILILSSIWSWTIIVSKIIRGFLKIKCPINKAAQELNKFFKKNKINLAVGQKYFTLSA